MAIGSCVVWPDNSKDTKKKTNEQPNAENEGNSPFILPQFVRKGLAAIGIHQDPDTQHPQTELVKGDKESEITRSTVGKRSSNR